MNSFKCPQCGKSLQHSVKTYTCSNGHSFDEAKQGYVNLHLVQNKKSKQPGDNDLMLKGRRNFLNSGHYQFLIDNIISQVNGRLEHASTTLLDIGCGEGYYLQKLANSFPKLILNGIDISKVGVKFSAKRKLQASLAVASSFDLPFFNNTFDFALSVFSPFCVDDTYRVLKPGGHFIVVGPGKKHLQSLAHFIYNKQIPHLGNFESLDSTTHFQLENEMCLAKEITVKGDLLLDLLVMTPYYWRTSQEIKHQLGKLDVMQTTADFVIRLYRKPPTS